MNLKGLISWSENEFSDLPWRNNRSLYRTLVSEIMLQQTTVGTVKNHFERFLKVFPDLESLASASEDELIVAWKGLGYYRRARNLKKIAESLTLDHKGVFPHDLNALMDIPGIGPYTASALVGIGMDRRALAVDANLERVISRLFGIESEKGLKLQKDIQKLFVEKKIFNEKVSFRKLNEALMDLGRTFCQARKAACELCPLRKDCYSFSKGNPLLLPKSSELKKKSVDHEIHLLRLFVIKGGKILVYRKDESEWLAGQYEVPTFLIKTTDKSLKQYPVLDYNWTGGHSFKSGITKYKIENKIVILTEKDFKKFTFSRDVSWQDASCEKSNLTTATLKGLKLIRS